LGIKRTSGSEALHTGLVLSHSDLSLVLWTVPDEVRSVTALIASLDFVAKPAEGRSAKTKTLAHGRQLTLSGREVQVRLAHKTNLGGALAVNLRALMSFNKGRRSIEFVPTGRPTSLATCSI